MSAAYAAIRAAILIRQLSDVLREAEIPKATLHLEDVPTLHARDMAGVVGVDVRVDVVGLGSPDVSALEGFVAELGVLQLIVDAVRRPATDEDLARAGVRRMELG